MRERRRTLAPGERQAMDKTICRHIEQLGAYRRARRVALFLDFDGEPSITLLPERTAGRGKQFFAPVLNGTAIHFRAIARGAGYYDQCFAFLHRRNLSFRPKLVGVGYCFQEVAALPRDPWDVPLWGVVCERGFRARHAS